DLLFHDQGRRSIADLRARRTGSAFGAGAEQGAGFSEPDFVAAPGSRVPSGDRKREIASAVRGSGVSGQPVETAFSMNALKYARQFQNRRSEGQANRIHELAQQVSKQVCIDWRQRA